VEGVSTRRKKKETLDRMGKKWSLAPALSFSNLHAARNERAEAKGVVTKLS